MTDVNSLHSLFLEAAETDRRLPPSSAFERLAATVCLFQQRDFIEQQEPAYDRR